MKLQLKLKSPVNYSNIENPLVISKKDRNLGAMHTNNLKAAGVHPPKSPLK